MANTDGNDNSSAQSRYNLHLPANVYDEVKQAAHEEQISIIEWLRKCIKLGLMLTKILSSPNAKLIVREGDNEREIILL